MSRGRDTNKDRVIELHLKGVDYYAISVRLGVTEKHVGKIINDYKRKQGDNNVQIQRTK